MNEDEMGPLEKLLRMIAAAAPQPWYPRQYAETTRFPLDVLLYYLEHLWLDGLLQKGDMSEWSAGLLLSPAGEKVLREPESLRRLRDGEPLEPGDRGGIVRAVFRKPQRPVLTRLLLWANVLWFAWGFYLAQRPPLKAGRAFLATFEHANVAAVNAQQAVLHQTGAVMPDDLVHRQWWRLLSCCFVHIGLIHLACNMYGVYAIGRGAEQMWGRVRYLAIYLLSGFCGSCVALAYGPGAVRGEPPQFVPTLLAGASGALCGILGAEFVWLLLNGRFLPRRIVRRWWWGMVINLLLLGGFSAMANVSALAHGGGLAVGALAAVLLNVQRFSRARWRWLTLLPLAALPWAGYELIQRQRAVSEIWLEAEKHAYQQDLSLRLGQALHEGAEVLKPAAGQSVERQLAATTHALQRLAALEADLPRPGEFRSKDVVAECEKDRATVAELLNDLRQREETLRPLAEREEKRKEEEARQRAKREAEDEQEETAFTRKFWNRVGNTTTTAKKVFAEQAQPQFARKREDRDPATAKAIAEHRSALRLLAADLKAVGEYRSGTAENARRVGLDYVAAMDRLLKMAEDRLAAEAWTQEEADAMKVQEVTAEQRQSDWLKLADEKK
jgi:membrane associated rhomboid family serine protease